LVNVDWPDRLDSESGTFTYYGDNRTPGGELHSTPLRGNRILRDIYALLHNKSRHAIPPIFVFTKGGMGKDVCFRGLAVPGAIGVPPTGDLVAVWKSTDGKRFQNYRALFTLLDTPVVRREWLEAIVRGDPRVGAPPSWLDFLDMGRYRPLVAEPTRRYRTPREQLPVDDSGVNVLSTIVEYFHAHPQCPYALEACALERAKRSLVGVVSAELTRPWRDGGRDAMGLFEIGEPPSGIRVEFALEAKCMSPSPSNSCGVRQVSRLLSRLRHRQFGIFVTTSCLGTQAYQELVEDQHPVVVIAGQDIVRTLRQTGLSTVEDISAWLKATFPGVSET